ncbi:carbohydrate kinase family protein [Caulobacter sp. UNC279MFTsu5.1]|uniref:carbohydrate kinase family protein n=1 Tax=Caulobacter sp. UNC279MFTsu5.1 TaxID=1502775 RepID=UPI00035E21ED|nr:PfkB family carbohydrate kinase [Caulobacter sp. UNC279MFTsu5.1]SFK58124.1 Sugar or nucleoside kinase, ribokinase family [Caulobacter sp. UNC279MFTsu5.1]
MKTGLACIGLTTLDVVARAIDALPEGEGTTLIEGIACAPAGTAAGTALVAAKLGMPVKLASAVGDDLIGRFIRMALDEAGVDLTALETLPGLPSSTTVLAVDSAGRRPNFHALGAGILAQVTPEALAAARSVGFFHYAGIGGPRLDGGPGAGIVQAAREAGAIVTCDLISPQATALDELKRLLPFVDYFMPSAAEALFLTGREDLFAAADVFRELGAGGCIIKNGSRGSVVVLDGVRTTLPAYLIKPVDTTSCGDSYCAGFIAALDRGWAPLEAVRFATATAALVAQGLATLGKLESFEATETAMCQMTLRETA